MASVLQLLLSVFFLLPLHPLLTVTVAQTDCPDTLSSIEFIDYVKRFSDCDASSSSAGSIFQDYAPILDSVYDDDDVYIGNVDYEAVGEFCSKVANCKSALSSCQGELYQVIENAGKALCQNGNAMTKDIQSAVSELAKTSSCDLTKLYDLSNSDGCFLGPDEATTQTYVQYLERAKKITSAEQRCALRFKESHSVCSAAGAKAYGTILAASQNLEKIGTTYNSFESYNQVVSGERQSLKLFGLTHLSIDGDISTCRGLSTASLLLWNTRIRITATTKPLMPMSDLHSLNQITIQFSGKDGVVVDRYTASLTEEELSYQTQTQQANQDTVILAKKIDKNQVLLIYQDISTTISIGHYGNNLAVVVNMPSSLLDEETVGLLVDGCSLYSGTAINVAEEDTSAECRSNCSSVESYTQLCPFDCSNELQYKELYNSIESLSVAAATEIPNGSTKPLNNYVTLLVIALLVYCHTGTKF